MHLDFMRDSAKCWPDIADPDAYRSARIWHSKFRSLKEIGKLSNLETLVIATYPDLSLDPISELSSLVYLRILHLPKISDLSPLGKLPNLEVLALETTPGWDSSGKVQEVESLQPIADLPRLKHLELLGVVPRDRSLSPLERCPPLETANFSMLPRAEIDRFFELTGIEVRHVPEPTFSAA